MARDLRSAPIVAAALAVAVLVVQGGPAVADDGEDKGRRLYRRGQELLKSGDFRGAARAFEAGYAATPRPGFLLNIGNCYRKLGELGKARRFYWRFLDAVGKDHPSRPEVLEYLQAMQQIEADGVAVDATPPADPPPPPLPPPAAVVVPATTFRATVAPAALVDLAAARSPADESAPIYRRWWVWTVVGGALAAGATAVLLAQRPGPAACRATLGCARE